jgi:hypothetical protein
VYRGRGQSKPGCFIEILIAEQRQSATPLCRMGGFFVAIEVHVGHAVHQVLPPDNSMYAMHRLD